MQNNLLSVNELSKVLKGEGNLEELGTFSEVDIVFIAGLFLHFKTNKRPLSISFKFDNNSTRNEIHKHYFKQIKDLYNVSQDKIVKSFPNLKPSKSLKVNSYSSSFAPPIHITSNTIDCFFGNKQDTKIYKLKGIYINKLSDRSNFTNKEDKNYFKQQNNIIQYLKESPPIYTFIFSVVYHKYQPFFNFKEKGIDSPTIAIKQLWRFTQEYARGLHELAKNIVEHSGKGENDGQGMITIRAYSDEEKDKTKILETHVFDYAYDDNGNKGILQKLKEYTTSLKEYYSGKLAEKETSESEKRWLETMVSCYSDDLKKLENNYELANFIVPPETEDMELQQQVFRDIAHFGLRKFYNLINKYNGEMYLSSNGNYFKKVDNKKENDIENKSLDYFGTSFFFQIPFNPKTMFKDKEVTTYSQVNLTTTLGSTNALRELHKIQHLVISPNKQNNTQQCIEQEKKKYLEQEIWQDVILDFKIKLQVEKKEDVPELYECFEDLNKLHDIKIKFLAIDLGNMINDVSILLRFLSHLTAKYDYPIIIYNLNNELYYEMVLDIENFYTVRRTQDKKAASYWHDDRAILLYTKTTKYDFFFADILYGKEEGDFFLANKIINNTFPNSRTILQENKKIAQKYSDRFSSNKNLQSFFYDQSLLPFDTILQANNSQIFLSNLTTILKNELPQKNEFSDSNLYSNTEKLNLYIERSRGYHISKTHFKIGGKIHSEDYYYAKGLFQNSFYTTRLAMHISNELAEKIIQRKITNLTLIGYEVYSELLLSSISKFLEDRFKEKITVAHFIAQDEDGKLNFKPQNSFEDYLNGKYKKESSQAIIIVPIASTGSTAKKILEALKSAIVSYTTKEILKNKSKDEALEEAKKEAKKINFLNPFYNILWAKPIDEVSNFGLTVKSIKVENYDIMQKSIIELPVVWHSINNCKLCYEKDDIRPLFETDKSSLTPTIVFGYPTGKSQIGMCDIVAKEFDEVDFSDSLKYMTTYRNNEFLLYSTNTERLIKKNNSNIVDWLKSINKTLTSIQYEQYLAHRIPPQTLRNERDKFIKDYNINEIKADLKEEMLKEFVKLYIKDKGTAYTEWKKHFITLSDRIIIISPCHETNSGFINLVNQYVFNSAATIIHYQSNVDFAENFKKMNLLHLNSPNTKIFYVDDSLITGKHFFNLFDLVRGSKEISQFDGTIVLSDKSTAFVHNRIARWSRFMFSFVSYNQPPSIALSEQRPLEYERQRYKSLSNIVLHDALIKTFNQKFKKLNPEKTENKYTTAHQSRRHLRLFEATHKIYDYFSEERSADFKIDSTDFVNFKDKSNEIENNNAIIKILSQYPFVLYRPLKEKTFEWHKKLLELSLVKIEEINETISEKEYYDVFMTFKLLIRRATFLCNFQIIEKDTLDAILKYFKRIDRYFSKKKYHDLYNQKLPDEIEKNFMDFPIFLLNNYLEMIQKNGWVAIKLIQNIKQLNNRFSEGTSLCKQFFRMLQIETAIVIDDYVKMIEKELRFKWRDMYKYTLETKYNDINTKKLNIEFITHTLYIKDFFEKNKEILIEKINKYEIIKEFLQKNLPDNWYQNIDPDQSIPFENYLWIKQMIFNDTIDRKSHFPQNINYQTKIDAIIDKMKGFFHEKKIQTFFIVTDNEQKPYVLYDKEYILQGLEEEHYSNVKNGKGTNFENSKFSEIFKFLYGMKDVQNIAVETIKEYEKIDTIWKDCYNEKNQEIKIGFLSDNKYLLLIRLSKSEEDGHFITSGMLGFYGEQLPGDEPDGILAKQLLMLLRSDMNKFIEKHHKNDEFAKLREEEIRNRYAYLAGHGRKMLQDLIENNDCRGYFADIVGTINKLQYVFSTETHIENRIKILREAFPYEKVGDISGDIEKMAEKIFETPIIENKVELEKTIALDEDSKKILNDFHFSHKLLKFILFELLINAKKNRFHFIKDDDKKNDVNISIKRPDTQGIDIEINGTGAKFNFVMQDRINNNNSHIKDKNKYGISSGIELMRDVLGLIDHENTLSVDVDLEAEHVDYKIYRNKVKVRLKEMK